MSHVVACCPPDFAVLSGDDSMTLPLLAVGGSGVISTTANVAPELMCALVRSFQAGDVAEARRIHHQLLPLFDALFCETNPIPLKAALGAMGLIDEEIRLPLTALTKPNRARLTLALKGLGFL
jgi:4-hydroxy-tetrahydrodipicolinate synthase